MYNIYQIVPDENYKDGDLYEIDEEACRLIFVTKTEDEKSAINIVNNYKKMNKNSDYVYMEE
jgi:hypothetical protein